MYAYCSNDPVSYADYNGKDAIYVADTNYDNFIIQMAGHAILYLQDQSGQWHITEFTGSEKSNATITVQLIERTEDGKLNDILLNNILDYRDIEGVSYDMEK